ncbi:MAG: hypothetical protein ISS72_04415 [Candidatus Brocadiae bacterium]|nr:hypothetical protein [Candidatus Brocadiia bacterium]
MAQGKMCPFLASAFMKGVQQVPVTGDGKVRPEVTCCHENCQWWSGGQCVMQTITQLAEMAKRLEFPGEQPTATA